MSEVSPVTGAAMVEMATRGYELSNSKWSHANENIVDIGSNYAKSRGQNREEKEETPPRDPQSGKVWKDINAIALAKVFITNG